MKIALYIHHPEVEAWRFTDAHVQQLQKHWPQDSLIWTQSEGEFLEILPKMEAAVAWWFDETWFAQAPSLRWLATPAAGKDHLPKQPPPGVHYTFGSFHGKIMAETVLGMMLSVCRNLHGWKGSRLQESWPQGALSGSMRLLSGSSVVLCGLGPIGQAIGRRLKTFDVQLTGVRRKAHERFDWMGAEDRVLTPEQADKEDAWAGADHVILALPGGEATRHFLSASRIQQMPQHARVYNVGRGSCIDESALIEALQAQTLGGAFLDVFDQEPLPLDSPLRRLANVHLLPHISAVSEEYLPLFIEELIAARYSLPQE